MFQKKIIALIFLSFFIVSVLFAQNQGDRLRPVDDVNVFLGTSGDHGQLSPAASSPFSYLSIGPQTYPHSHAGYEYLAKRFDGFTHNRFEGVGCKGSGGVILVKPFLGDRASDFELIKNSDHASPGYYYVSFKNGIRASFAVDAYEGIHQYNFPKGSGPGRMFINLSYAFNNAFVEESHKVSGNKISGWVKAKTTCGAGIYTLFFSIKFDEEVQITNTENKHELIASLASVDVESLIMRIGVSSTSVEDAEKNISDASINQLKDKSATTWNNELAHIQVKGDAERAKLFYSLLYRAIQSPYLISEKDGRYRAVDGTLQVSEEPKYNGWSIWDNYKTQLPLLSFAFSDRYQAIISSIANLYRFGKKDFATNNEPSNSVRTEHAIIVLLDAKRKGYHVDFAMIYDSLKREVDNLSLSSPDRKLEAAYDLWAFSRIAELYNKTDDANQYLIKAKNLYEEIWKKEFKNLSKSDVDRLPARGMYQGTVWQYRWMVPYDLKGLIGLSGGEKQFITELDTFFGTDLYTHTNEPNIQAPVFYNATSVAWKSQRLMQKIGLDDIVEHYFNSNERGIGSYIGKVYQNKPQGLLRTMDDDGGAMSSWYILAACGIFPASVGYPIYYLNVPFFPEVKIRTSENAYFTIHVKNFDDKNRYIKQVFLNGKDLKRTWLKHEEIAKGGKLTLIVDSLPQKYGTENIFITDMK